MTGYEQLEYQRNNPHLFTTMSQSVNFDGSITTFDQVTSKIQDTLKKVQLAHKQKFGGNHPVYCMRPIIGQSENPICQMIEMLENDLDRCRIGFVRTYKDMQERIRSLEESDERISNRPNKYTT
jgi:hypothetical protein